jgi:hypothetical protein
LLAEACWKSTGWGCRSSMDPPLMQPNDAVAFA